MALPTILRRTGTAAALVVTLLLTLTAAPAAADPGGDGRPEHAGPPAATPPDAAPGPETATQPEPEAASEPEAAPEPVAPAAPEAAAPAADGVTAAGPPSPAPGNAGTVKIHRSTTPDDDRRNEPQVCEFRIVGFGFPADAELEITIEGHGGPNAGPDSFSGTVGSSALSADGDWAVSGPDLADGMYKLYVENTTAPGGAKQKVFHVDCPEAPPEPPAPEEPPPPPAPEEPPAPPAVAPEVVLPLVEAGELPGVVLPTEVARVATPSAAVAGAQLARTGAEVVPLIVAGLVSVIGGIALLAGRRPATRRSAR